MSTRDRHLRTDELREKQAKANITYSVQRKPPGQCLCTYWLIKKYVGSSCQVMPNVICILVGLSKPAEVKALGEREWYLVQRTQIHRKSGFLNTVRNRV